MTVPRGGRTRRTESENTMTMPDIGQQLPDLTFTSGFRETISTADLKGKENLVIAFYAAAFTGG